jgi:hypothetical protein
VLAGLHAHALDCLQVNLAAIADQAYGRGSHLALGSVLRFSVEPGANGLLTVSTSLADRLAQAEQLLGLTVRERRDEAAAPDLLELAAEHSPVYVVADAYDLNWSAYRGKQHMEHSFLLIDGGPPCLVADGYATTTAWGDSLPGVWQLPAAQLGACAPRSTALALEPQGLPALDANLTLAANAVAMAQSLPVIGEYLADLRTHRAEPAVSDQLTLDIWLLGRSRALHAAWLAASAPGSAGATAAAAQAETWQGLAAHSYLAARRVHRGGELSERLLDELADALLADVELARQLAVPAVQEVLVAEVSAVLGGDQSALRADADSVGATVLRDLPNFSSYRLVDIIDRTMSRLMVDVDPDRLSGSSLRDIASLRELFLPLRQQAGAL